MSLSILLLLSMVALIIGAGFGILLENRAWGIAALKGLMASFIGGLLVIHLLPEAYATLGPMSILLVIAGFLALVLPEQFAQNNHHEHSDRLYTAEILWIGLALHQLADGAALALASSDLKNDWQLAAVVLAHRIPVAAVIIWLFYRTKRRRSGWLRIFIMAIATLVGALFAKALAPLMSSGVVEGAYAFMAGSFLHFLVHDFLDHHAHRVKDKSSEFFGFVGGIALLIFSLGGSFLPGSSGQHAHHGHEHASGAEEAGVDAGLNFFETFLILLKETAPYLLLGLIVSGLIHAFMPASPFAWMRRGGPLKQSTKGMLFGLPLPICSCGVLPLFVSLSKKGAPPAALIAFLIATPELGIDSFLLSVKLLGVKFTVVRLIVAMVLPILIALLAVHLLKVKVVGSESTGSCCSGHHDHDHDQSKPSWWRFAFINLVDDIFPYVFFGLLVAALAQVLWPVTSLGNLVGIWDVLLLGALGIPFYVCASASVPFALILLERGFSVGAVVVFLFAGPATNVATILTVNQVFGPRSGIKLAGTAFCVAVMTGLLINLVYTPELLDVLEMHEHPWGVWDKFAVGTILLLSLLSLYRNGPLHWFSNLVAMIPGISHHPESEPAKVA